jgi:hypothetical protein
MDSTNFGRFGEKGCFCAAVKRFKVRNSAQIRHSPGLVPHNGTVAAALGTGSCLGRARSGRGARRTERDLTELLAFFRFPRHLWRKLRTTNIIERRFVEVRRRTRPMVCFVNVLSVDRIIYSIFQRFNLEWKTRALRVFTPAT